MTQTGTDHGDSGNSSAGVLHSVGHGIEMKPEGRDTVQMIGEKEAVAHVMENAGESRELDDVSLADPEHPEPTADQWKTLQIITDKIPAAALFIVLTELCERFTYYGLSGPFQNYIQYPYNPDGDQPGAIDGGQQMATGLTTFFQFWCYVTPIMGAIIADQYIGKVRAIILCSVTYTIGLIVLTATSIPSAIRGGSALPGLAVSMIIIGFGTGGIKSNVSPLIAEQYTRTRAFVKTKKDGTQVIVDPATTIQSIFNWFYWCINVGSLSAIATTSLERYVDFWPAYLLPTLAFLVGIIIFIAGRKTYRRVPPEGSVVVKAVRIIYLGIRRSRSSKHNVVYHTASSDGSDHLGTASDEKKKMATSEDGSDVTSPALVGDGTAPTNFNVPQSPRTTQIRNWMDYARPSTFVPEDLARHKVTWDDQFIDDLKRTLRACKVFLFYPIYWLCYSQITNNLISQASTMDTGGVPNDIMNNIDPLALTIMIPIFDRIIYPFLRRVGLNPKPVRRMAMGFMFAAIAMAYTAIIQHVIYTRGPNFDHPLVDSNGNATDIPNDITVGAQAPSYLFIALSEIFAVVTGLEYAYTKAPTSMKSIVMSLFLFTNCGGSILNFAFLPALYDPFLQYMYTILACITFVTGCVFWYCFRHYDDDEEMETFRDAPRSGATEDDSHRVVAGDDDEEAAEVEDPRHF
ncbi:peptide transporter ptr2 [Tieghemiomyces parasiticus]|uniref:Peptide transporter ptr2 n=1 Tax=Tieghemiomyces parasiticus TaxID=78921 RepID=A0A9W8AB12_9FUNG|nr:peptide transporter ptr2 [Tieghemiomyces parasiticus]